LFPVEDNRMFCDSGTLVLEAPTRKDGRTVKKVIMLVLACLITSSVLVGCGEPAKPTTKAAGPVTDTAKDKPPAK
jgi:hypothetical protein